MPTFPAISTIAQTIQLSISPIFMLAAIGALLNVLAGRLGRVVDRARRIEEVAPTSQGPEHLRHVVELRVLDRRIRLINLSLLLAVLSAVTTCLVVTLLFVAELSHLNIGTSVAVAFILAMVLLIASLAAFIVEVRVATLALRIRPELLERDR